jgi:hypothetical protein
MPSCRRRTRGTVPSLKLVMVSVAPSPAIRMSRASASSSPPVKQKPSMTAMIGTGALSIVFVRRLQASTASELVVLEASFRSRADENALSFRR